MPESPSPPSARNTALFVLDMFGAVLEASLPKVEPGEARRQSPNKQQRKAVTRELESLFTQLVQHLAPAVVLEIGAHSAYFARAIRRTLPDSRAIAFEANPEVYARHLAACEAAGVEFVNLCLAERAGTLQFSVPQTEDGGSRETWGSILPRVGTASSKIYKVEAVTADGYLAETADRPNALWIDVEGALGQVLAGAPRTLASCVALYAEVENLPQFEGQWLDAEVVPHLAGFGLVPVLRDVQSRGRAYNLMFLRADVLADPEVVRLCRGFVAKAMTPAKPRSEKAA